MEVLPRGAPESTNALTRTFVRICFCLAAAVIAAAVADPLVEAAANAGWFGFGRFTDHSTLDVVPALVAGCLLVLLQLVMRVHGAARLPSDRALSLLRVSDRALSQGAAKLLVATFTLQISVLFWMETAEQIAVYGHPLGGTIWLGGPIAVSLIVHGIACIAVSLAIARSVRALATTALCAIKFMRAMATLHARANVPLAIRRCEASLSIPASLVFLNAGERAPPLLTA
jgi:hypothetical protein